VGSPDAIPHSIDTIEENGCNTAEVEADGRVYGSLINYEYTDFPVGRIMGISSSDVSGYVARDLFFTDIPKNRDALLAVVEDYQSEIYDICQELGASDCNKNGEVLEEYARRYFWTENVRNEFDNENFYSGHEEANAFRDEIRDKYDENFLLLYDDHGNPTSFSYMMASHYLIDNKIYLQPSLVTGLACSTCHYYGQGDLFCAQGISRGVLAQQGAVDVSYWHQEFDNILEGSFIDGKTIGESYLEARNEEYNDRLYNFCSGLEGDNYYSLYGDPTWRPKWW
jgi:hypothetical protein